MKTFLTAQEVVILKEAHRASRSKKHADRIKTILLLNLGYLYSQITKILLLDDTTLRNYFKEYQKGGLELLVEDKYEGKASFLNSNQLKQLDFYLDKNLHNTVKEIIVFVKNRFNVLYSVEGMTNLLHKMGFTYKKTKIVPGKANQERQIEFIKQYEELKKTKENDDVILFLDGTHPTHNTRNSYGWIKKGEEKYIKTNTGRERLNINGALNLETKDLTVFSVESINREATINLFWNLEKKYPTGQINCICDNATYYKNKDVTSYLTTSRINLIFLPPYSPNLNPIEKLWHFFHKKILYNQYYPTFKEFEETALTFFKNLKKYKPELNTFVTDNFHLIPT